MLLAYATCAHVQAKKDAIEADLAATKAELDAREKELVARNAMLEQVATLNEADTHTHTQVSMLSSAQLP